MNYGMSEHDNKEVIDIYNEIYATLQILESLQKLYSSSFLNHPDYKFKPNSPHFGLKLFGTLQSRIVYLLNNLDDVFDEGNETIEIKRKK